MIYDSDSNLQAFKKDGVLVFENYLDGETNSKIHNEIHPWLSQIFFNSQISSSITRNNQWIEHLGLCSFHASEVTLHPNLINFAEQYFGEEVSLGSLQFQKKVFAEHSPKPIHSHYDKGFYFFIYLNAIACSTGATRFVKKSHQIEMPEDSLRSGETGGLYMDQNFMQLHQESVIQASGGPGTMLMWDRKTAHDLPAFKNYAPELIMASQIPKSENS